MDLKLRRNLPLLLLFVTLVAILVLGLGNQPIIAYTIDNAGAGDNAKVSDGNLLEVVTGFLGLTSSGETDTVFPAADAGTAAGIGSVSGSATSPAEYQAVAIDSASAGATTAQADEE